jgi:hypothetical protein
MLALIVGSNMASAGDAPKHDAAKKDEERVRFLKLLCEFAEEADGAKSLGMQWKMAEFGGFNEGMGGGLDSTFGRVREGLQTAVRKYLSAEDLPWLVEIAKRSRSVHARIQVIEFLVWMHAKEMLADLKELAKDADEFVREQAREAFDILSQDILAEIGVDRITVVLGKDTVGISLGATNLTKAPISYKTIWGESVLEVNGKEFPPSKFILAEQARHFKKVLAAGAKDEFWYPMEQYFQEPGSYEIVWKGKGFQSKPITIHVRKE